jgi:hypothetical protein
MTTAAQELGSISSQLAGLRSGAGLSPAMQGVNDEITGRVAATLSEIARELEQEAGQLSGRARSVEG